MAWLKNGRLADWQSWYDYRTVTGDDSLFLQNCVFGIRLDVVIGVEGEKDVQIVAMADSSNNTLLRTTSSCLSPALPYGPCTWGRGVVVGGMAGTLEDGQQHKANQSESTLGRPGQATCRLELRLCCGMACGRLSRKYPRCTCHPC